MESIVQRTVLAILLTLAVSTGFADKSEESPEPIFVYAFTGNPDVATTSKDGLLVDLLVDLGERGNRPDVASLKEALPDLSQQERFESSLGCAFVGVGETCQPIVFLEDEPQTHLRGSDELADVFQEYDVSRTWVLHITEQANQGGYNFGVTAAEMELTTDGFQRNRGLAVMYRDLFSKAADAHSRDLDRNDRKADPRIGSKEARVLYWISGEPPRIELLVRQSPLGAADMLRYLIAFTEGDTYKQFKDKITQFPRLRDHAMFKENK